MVGDFAVLYEADFQERVIRLLEVTRRLPTQPLEAHAGATAELDHASRSLRVMDIVREGSRGAP